MRRRAALCLTLLLSCAAPRSSRQVESGEPKRTEPRDVTHDAPPDAAIAARAGEPDAGLTRDASPRASPLVAKGCVAEVEARRACEQRGAGYVYAPDWPPTHGGAAIPDELLQEVARRPCVCLLRQPACERCTDRP